MRDLQLIVEYGVGNPKSEIWTLVSYRGMGDVLKEAKSSGEISEADKSADC